MITVPSLDPCTDILDTDEIMITHQNGSTDTISGANFNKRTQIISASSKTITGTPLKTGNVVRVFFTADITGSDTTTALVINYNGTNYNVKVPKDGNLVNFKAQNMGGSPVVYKYCQAYTELELYYDGTQFVIVGNPVVISDAGMNIQASGDQIFKNATAVKYEGIPDWTTSSDIQQCLNSLRQSLPADFMAHVGTINISGHGYGIITWFLYSPRNYGWIEYKELNGSIIHLLSIYDNTVTYKFFYQ